MRKKGVLFYLGRVPSNFFFCYQDFPLVGRYTQENNPSGGSIGDGTGDGIKAVDNGVGWCGGRDGEVVMVEADSVRDAEGLGFGIDGAMAAVMLQEDANVESIRATEVPGAASGWLIVGDDRAAEWEERGGIVVEGIIEVFPGGHAWCDGGLAEEVECQFCLWKEQVPKVAGEGGR